MTAIVFYLLAFDALVVVIVLGYLLVQTRQLLRFSGDLKGLPPTNLGAEAAPFSGSGELPKLGNQFMAAFRTADSNNALSQFDVEKQLTPVALRLRSMGTSTRGIAGLLILVALVITLLNLQGAVASLGDTFRQLADPTQKQNVVSSVQNAMGDVAGTASSAFLLSGVTVGAALHPVSRRPRPPTPGRPGSAPPPRLGKQRLRRPPRRQRQAHTRRTTRRVFRRHQKLQRPRRLLRHPQHRARHLG